MKPTLHISKEISLPIDIAGKKISFLGTTGSGKSYAAMKLAEELLSAGIQTVALDVVGVWFGLRVSRDGQGRGFPIVVFGGLHGDIPITPDAGALVADIIVDRNLSAVIDISQMESDAEAGRFSTAFAKQLFQRRKAKPAVTMLFLEECQELVPENPVGQSENMKLHIFTRMVKIGRNFGIGVILISQRPQEVSKRALNLSECVFAFQMNGHSEREAMRKWLKDAGADDVDVNVLPTLPVGVAHLWSPRWLKVSQEVHILPKKTFDSSGTPDYELSSTVVVKPLQPADIEKITAAMAATIEKVKADDPAELRKKITGLEKQVNVLSAAHSKEISRPGHSDPDALKREFDRGAESVKRILGKDIAAYRAALGKIQAKYLSSFDAAFRELDEASSVVSKIEIPVFTGIDEAIIQAKIAASPVASTQAPPRASPPRPQPSGTSNGTVSGLRRNILTTLAQHGGCSNMQKLATLAGSTVSGHFKNELGGLRSAGYISPARVLPVEITDAGAEALGNWEALPTGKDLQAWWISNLGGGLQAKMLSALISRRGRSTSMDELAEDCGTVVSGHFKNELGSLRTKGLISPARTPLAVSEHLFED